MPVPVCGARTRAEHLIWASTLRASRLPSDWTPIELLKHLTYVELRWLEWGFEGCAAAEYARHIGHLDIVCELAGDQTGE